MLSSYSREHKVGRWIGMSSRSGTQRMAHPGIVSLLCLSLLAGCGVTGGAATQQSFVETGKPLVRACGKTLDRPHRDTSGFAFNPYLPSDNDGLSAVEAELYALIMAHRATLGLPSVPLSSSLTLTAGSHAQDSAINVLPTGLREGTNMHSWSDVDYTPDHSQSRLMWEAPARLGTPYCGNGFEISALGYQTPQETLAGWLTSPGHRAVIENTGIWANSRWRAIGVGYAPIDEGQFKSVWHVWFGTERDPAGPP